MTWQQPCMSIVKYSERQIKEIFNILKKRKFK